MSYVKQVGGEHYKSQYQHWDWVADIGMNYHAGCATKYIVRWRDKGGVKDLEKALSYIDKIILLEKEGRLVNKGAPLCHTEEITRKFLRENNIPLIETEILRLFTAPYSHLKMDIAKGKIRRLIHEASGAAGCTTTQAAASNTSTEGTNYVDRTGMEHPFGYEAENE